MPGCNCLNPFCGESVAGVLSLRVQQLDVTCGGWAVCHPSPTPGRAIPLLYNSMH
jgi:hypothetical protein